MSSFFAGRNGLILRDNGGRVGHDDLNQGIDLAAAARSAIMAVLGGGDVLWAGGAAVLADLTGSGKNYPAVTLCLKDDSSNPLWFNTTSPTSIAFNVTTAAGGTGRLYAVPAMIAGASPAAADGRLSQVTFVADINSATPPAHSLLLGSGTIASSAFTTWTPASLSPGVPLLGGIGKLASTNTWTARNTFTNGLRSVVRDTKFGPPTSGTYVTGDEWRDAAGSAWYCNAGGTPGTWEQTAPGRTTVWSGAGAGDVTAAAQWNGGALLDGYRIHEPGKFNWVYNLAATRWLSEHEFMFTVAQLDQFSWTNSRNAVWCKLPSGYDYYIVKCGFDINGTAGTWTPGTDYWTAVLQSANIDLTSGSPIALATVTVSAAGYQEFDPTVSPNLCVRSSKPQLTVRLTKTGSPASIASLSCTVTCRLVRL